MQYLVTASGGPSFHDREEALGLLQNLVLPGLHAIMDLQANGTIVAGGIPVGQRAGIFIFEAADNAALDEVLRELPLWPLLEWEVIPLEAVAARVAHEDKVVAALKAGK